MGGSNDLLLRLFDLGEQLPELKEVLTYIYPCIKDLIQDTNQQPGEETHGAQSFHALSGCATVPSLHVVTNLEALTQPFRVFMEASLHSHG